VFLKKREREKRKRCTCARKGNGSRLGGEETKENGEK